LCSLTPLHLWLGVDVSCSSFETVARVPVECRRCCCQFRVLGFVQPATMIWL
jgi:hypothetical protein